MHMDILEHLSSIIKEKEFTIGIGLSPLLDQNKIILRGIKKFLKKYHSDIFLYGSEKIVENFSTLKELKEIEDFVSLISGEEIEKKIISDLKADNIQGIIRGSISSSKFLAELRNQLDIDDFTRLALLETSENHQFFYGPVGIDECINLDKKKKFIKNALMVCKIINIQPKVSLLSGGRIGDVGRDQRVDATISDADELASYFKSQNKNVDISHDEILIEKAINRGANIIIAPEGISGNLIYRTLVHLGAGRAHGAIYTNILNKLKKIVIDTSRVGKESEIHGSLVLSAALISLRD